MRWTWMLSMVIGCGGAGNAATSGPAADGGAESEGPDSSAPDAAGEAGACATTVTAAPGVVLTDRGPVRGTQQGGTWAFEGIPYAAPPVGPLRWAATQPHACWTTALDATAFGSMCLQVDSSKPSNVLGDEDCLTANVWAPSGATPSSKLPVLVFIHGGGNVQGSSADKASSGGYVYDGAALAAKENAVVVTFNYRLGALGFVAHPSFGAHPGNYGTLDQAFALGWVARNAAAFGGDASHVLLFGQSAGAVDVCAMVASPLAKGLFSAAIMESGGCVAQPAATAQSFAQSWASKAGCGSAADVASCLRALSGTAVTQVQPEPASIAGKQGDYQPNVDGVALTGSPDAVIRAGAHNHVPFVIGSNSDETSLELAKATPQGMTAAQYQAAVLAYVGGDTALASQVEAMYPVGSFATPLQAYVQVTTDAKFTSTATYDACVAALGQPETPVWRYFFAHHLDDGTAIEKALGAWHGQELAFVFRDLAEGNSYTPSAGEQALADTMGAAWTSMASAGAPGGTPGWPRYAPATDPYVAIDDTLTVAAGLRTSLVQFWNGVLGRHCP
jgi:para-nitrobenzyl esterase